ncbi:MAG: hypothetical protein U1D67_04610, partial [Dehalococcoidia bacterium]|nr:hypothetical protein [Dehalococcoidia bacterium]
MSKTIYFLFACIVLVAMVGTACGRSAPVPAPTSAPTKEAVPEWQARWDKTLAAAKQEGSVRMYIIMSTGVREELAKGFQQKYGIELEYVAAPPADIAQRFISEASAGRNQADVFNTGGTTLLTVVKPKGLIVPFEPELILPEV